MSSAIVLFNQDLRLSDNPALVAATKSGRPLVLLYVLNETIPWSIGSAQKWWLHESLSKLHPELVLRRGPLAKTVLKVAKEANADAIYWNRCYEPDLIKDYSQLKNSHYKTYSFNGSLLVEPWEIKTRSGHPFKIFTPFWKHCLEVIDPAPPLSKPNWQTGPKIYSENLASWKLQPVKPNWALGMTKTWTPGEAEAKKKLTSFLNKHLTNYHQCRDHLDLASTSRLSPYLHFGEISPRQIWFAIKKHQEASGLGAKAFLRELGWREFSYYILYHFPQLPNTNFNHQFDLFKWNKNPQWLNAWQFGMTGYPMVDAGMRQLIYEGWMHNRVRMVVASFLVKDLLIDWREGEKWFWDTLLDADLANNAANWQWVAGCGADAAPYFRIFNPILQGEKFDPEGKYVRKWVPELKKIPTQFIHKPWKSELCFDYPSPIVNHFEARDLALQSYHDLSFEAKNL
ncbi:MAG: deoxyribodipyrimidine photo-lyase [Chlamydiia bacterium]|nr:deoxyribodipyrimidine photo-lyase [Chlamydiia bacterium]